VCNGASVAKSNLHRFGTAACLAGLVLLNVGRGIGGTAEFSVVPGESRVVIGVGKAGMLAFAGHAHEVLAPAVSGTVTLDGTDWPRSGVSLEFQAAALTVTGKDESPSDVPEVQRTMLGARVLDAERFPKVSFRSTRVALQAVTTGGADLRVEGTVTLHGVTQPLSVPVHVTLDGSGTLTARGQFSLKQSAYGIQPVTAAGGTIRVKDDVDVQFTVKARR
jgi:polyisoprenoid-binding protein YceI